MQIIFHFQNSDTCSCGLPWEGIRNDREKNLRYQFPWQVYIERLVEKEDDNEDYEYYDSEYEYEDDEVSAENEDYEYEEAYDDDDVDEVSAENEDYEDAYDDEGSENNVNLKDLSMFRSSRRIKSCMNKKRKARQGGNAERLRRSFQQHIMVEDEPKKELTSPLLLEVC